MNILYLKGIQLLEIADFHFSFSRKYPVKDTMMNFFDVCISRIRGELGAIAELDGNLVKNDYLQWSTYRYMAANYTVNGLRILRARKHFI